jgi:hypothetical protein
VVDNLDIHTSESLVRYTAERDHTSVDLGVNYVGGVLRSRASRAAFLAEPTCSIVFHYVDRNGGLFDARMRGP